MENEKLKDEQAKDNIVKPVVSGSYSQKLRQELVDLYMQGWLDRDWKISEDDADEKAETYADGIMKKYKL